MNSTQSQIVLKPIERVHINSIAKLHVEGISTGFISSLGIGFVRSLYRAIVESKYDFGFVVEENGKVLGFIVFTADLGKLYRAVILKKGVWFVLLLAGKMFSRRLKNIFETLFYPARIKKFSLPSAELLAIVIAEKKRQRTIYHVDRERFCRV